jgi:hypothetical protein
MWGVRERGAKPPEHLELLCVNKGWAPMSLSSVVAASLLVSVELTVTTLFATGFLVLRYQVVRADAFLAALGVLTVAGCVLLRVSPGGLLSTAALLCTMYVMTPVLASLARSVSDDTVATVTCLLLLLHLFSFDFFSSSREVRALVSTNAGLLSAILLCSRLPSYPQVFACVLLGLVLFALWPVLMARVCALLPRAHIVLGVVLPLATTTCLFHFFSAHDPDNLWAVPLFVCVVLFVTVAAPLIFYRLQRLKHILSGQWTEATVQVN